MANSGRDPGPPGHLGRSVKRIRSSGRLIAKVSKRDASWSTPPPRRVVSAGLFLTAGDGQSVSIVGATSSGPALGITSPDSPAIVIERRVSSPPGALTRVWSAPPIPEATDNAP